MLALELKDQGMILRLNDDELIVRTLSPLTDDLRAYLKQHKLQLIAELKVLSRPERKCCMWFYRLKSNLPGFIQMGLMTDDPQEAQRQLTAIYGRQVGDLHKQDQRINAVNNDLGVPSSSASIMLFSITI